MKFSNDDQRDMIQIYYTCNRNARNSAETYLQTYPERRQPHHTYFLRLHRSLGECGSFNEPRNRYGRRVPEENTEAIIQEVGTIYRVFLC